MNGWFNDLRGVAEVVLGLVLGSFGRFGLDLDQGAAIERRRVVAHVMMLGVLGLLAYAGVALVHGGQLARVLAGAGAALLSGRLVTRFRDWSEQRAARELPILPSAPAAPAVAPPPTTIGDLS